MSIEENPNKSQAEKIREEIPDGIGYGKQKESNHKTMNDFAHSLNKEEQENSNQSDN